jgi:hypothetical protein
MLFLKPVKFEYIIKMLVSSANKIGVDLSFINAGKSFIYIRKSKGPNNRNLWNTMLDFFPI